MSKVDLDKLDELYAELGKEQDEYNQTKVNMFGQTDEQLAIILRMFHLASMMLSNYTPIRDEIKEWRERERVSTKMFEGMAKVHAEQDRQIKELRDFCQDTEMQNELKDKDRQIAELKNELKVQDAIARDKR